jgi:hypothetical protein
MHPFPGIRILHFSQQNPRTLLFKSCSEHVYDNYIVSPTHRVHIFLLEMKQGLVCLPTQLERTLQLYW